jgi:flavin-dependent thymidylate synthase
LWSQGHETPFEKASIHFLVNCDIASHIHLLKHRISSLNAESARYKELKEDKFYLPEDWDVPTDNLPLIGYGYKAQRPDNWAHALELYTMMGNQLYHECLTDLTPILGRKRAKESARFFKTYNSQIQADVSFNLRSFANFLRLRNSEHAQLEIREIAQQMQSIVEGIEDKPFKTAMWIITRANELWIEKQEELSKQLVEEFKKL